MSNFVSLFRELDRNERFMVMTMLRTAKCRLSKRIVRQRTQQGVLRERLGSEFYRRA